MRSRSTIWRNPLSWMVSFFGTLVAVTRMISADPCSGAIRIGNPSRSVNHELGIYDYPLCDSGLEEGMWYRFDTDGLDDHLAEECPADYHCGTLMPIWMDGTHPRDVGPIKSARICGSWGAGECCGWSAEIKVTKCPGDGQNPAFYAYQLADPPYCDAAYCTVAGEREMCERGSEYNPNLKKCVPHHPAMTGFPTITGPKILSNTGKIAKLHPHYFVFECNVGYPKQEKDDGARFEITFTFNGVQSPKVPPVIVSSTNPVAVLKDTQLRGNLGKTIKCSVISYWSFDDTRRSEALVPLEGYFAGIKTTPTSPISMKEGDIIKVEFLSTIPVLIPNHPIYKRRGGAGLSVRVQGTSRYNRGESCQVTMNEAAWTGAKSPKAATLKIKAVPDIGTKTQFIQAGTNFRPIRQMLMDVWTGYTPDSVLVTIKDEVKSGTCKSTGDPHITTFDGKYYHNFLVGDFLLWRSLDPNLHFEIHVRQTPWHRRPVASANCAVAVREHNTILGIDRCRGDPARFITFLSEDTKRGHINRINSRYYEIVMASGVVVKVWFWDKIHLSLHTVIPGHYHGKTEGLCGSYNGEKNDDFNLRDTGNPHPGENQQFPNKFSESYRIHPTKSFFGATAECKPDHVPSYQCECKGLEHKAKDRHVECGLKAPANKVTTVKAAGMQCDELRRHKRSIKPEESPENEDTDDTISIDELLSSNVPDIVLTPPDLSQPTAGGITLAFARSKCLESVKLSPVYNDCVDVVNITEIIESCATDAMLADTYNGVDEVRDELGTACMVQAEANLVFNVTHGAGRAKRSAQPGLNQQWFDQEMDSLSDDYNPTLEKLKMIQMAYCPLNCNGRGTCIDGSCHCDKGYLGEDCSLSAIIPPVINSVFGSPKVCDLSKRACRKFRLKVSNTAEQFSCKFTQKHFLNVTATPEAEPSKQEYVVPGEFVTIGEVICHHSIVQPISPSVIAVQYDISISNDGETFSDPVSLFAHDSSCTLLSENGGNTAFSMERDYCVIKQRCYTAGSVNPQSEKSTCNPRKAAHQWSFSEEVTEEKSWMATHVTLIIVIVVQVLVISFIAACFIYYFKKRRSGGHILNMRLRAGTATESLVKRGDSVSTNDQLVGKDNPYVYF